MELSPQIFRAYDIRGIVGEDLTEEIVHRIATGHGQIEDIALIDDVCDRMVGKTICVLADAAAFPAWSIIRKFRDEFIHCIEHGGSPAVKKRHPERMRGGLHV